MSQNTSSPLRRLLVFLLPALVATPLLAQPPRLCTPGQKTPYVESLELWLSGSAREAAGQVLRVHNRHHRRHHHHAKLKPDDPRARLAVNRLEHPWDEALSYLEYFHDPRTLLPIAALHAEAHALQVRSCLYQEAAETRQFLGALIGRLLDKKRGATPEVRQAAALMWTRMAVSLRTFSQIEDARASFERALEHSPDHAFTLLSLGALFEKLGDYTTAAQTFGELPGDEEARLRLALSEARLGQGRSAIGKLEGLTREGPEWIRAVAYQELVQLLLERKAMDEAAAVLHEGREQFPENPRLAVLQLFLRSDRSEASSQVLDQLAFSGQGPRESSTPRAIYNRWPDGADEAVADFYKAVVEYEPLLERALKQEGCL